MKIPRAYPPMNWFRPSPASAALSLAAPPAVVQIVADLPPDAYELIDVTPEAEALRDQYVAARIVSPSYEDDALHVAVATVHRADLVVSWNFKHMLHIDKIRPYNAVNLMQGYQAIDIRSPREVVPS